MDSTTSNKICQTAQPILAGGKAVPNTNCPKMGSRRIFTPQFKLQVLESYRNDHDCKGNQRATARKYNIHRRQIQKWLQCEASLRSSVVNINQNAVKHQFHNVSMQQQHTKNINTPPAAVNGLSCTSSHLQSAHLCLDSTKVSTPHTTIEVPSLSSSVISSISSVPEGADILTNSTDIPVSAVVSPLRPSAIISATKSTTTSMSPLLHHHHHYGIQQHFSSIPASTVPILVHHLNNSQQIYQYENVHYTAPPTLAHHQTEKDHATYLAPLVLPTTSVNANYTGATSNERFDKFDMLLLGAKTYPKTLPNKNYMYNSNQFHATNESSNVARFENSTNALEPYNIHQFGGESTFSSAFSFGPMDLSLRHNKETKPETTGTIVTSSSYPITETPIKKQEVNNAADVVDLTNRKRRLSNTSHTNNDYKNEYPEKQQKLSNTEEQRNNIETIDRTGNFPQHASSSNCTEDDDVEIEVGTEEKFPPTSKPVKLFKPYLLDEYENNDVSHLISNNKTKLSSKNKMNEEQILERDDAAANTFPDAVKENINVCVDSTNFFVESRSESPRSASSPATYLPTLSPTNFQYSKGSPASSGYESSTSTYSDTSLSSKNDTHPYGQTYSLNLQMQTIYHENIHVIRPSKHVQRWLEKDDSNSLETNSSIALFV